MTSREHRFAEPLRGSGEASSGAPYGAKHDGPRHLRFNGLGEIVVRTKSQRLDGRLESRSPGENHGRQLRPQLK